MTDSNDINIVWADLNRPDHAAAVLELTRSYSRDPMGNGRDLDAEVKDVLIERLRAHPTCLIFLAYQGETPIGIASCFIGFSTFSARPLINIHDLHVLPDRQGRGVGRNLLKAVEERAKELNCCKLTLEVLQNNHRARGLYEAVGFAELVYQPEAGPGLFLTKALR